jgi:hypothetical protein
MDGFMENIRFSREFIEGLSRIIYDEPENQKYPSDEKI